MKNLSIFLIVLFVAFKSSLCFGQELANENGLRLTYKIGEKIGSRYDEYCKTTFYIYPVEGTVENNNTDKAAMVTAILSFEGQSCNKVYSNDNNTTGEIVNKLFNLDIWGQAKKQSQYWVNRFVHLLPKEKMTAKGHVEVQHEGKVPEPDKYFTYELITGADNSANKGSENSEIRESSIKSTISHHNKDNYLQMVVGEWKITREYYIYNDGKEVDRTELFRSYIFEPNGSGMYLGNGEDDKIKYVVKENKLLIISSDDSPWDSEILKLNDTTLILKYLYPDSKETGMASIISIYTKVKK